MSVFYSKGEFAEVSAGLFVQDLALDQEDLPDAGEVEVRVERLGDPDGAGFDAPVSGARVGEVSGGSMLEVPLQVLEERGGDFDLIGLFEFIAAGYGEATDLFWA